MAVDISPEILEEIEKNFEEYYKDPSVKRIYKKIVDGTATYSDMQILSSLVAKHVYQSVEKAYTDALKSGKLPDDKLYENIVDKTLRPPLKTGHGIVTEACGYVQTDLNRKSGIKLNAVEPEINESKVKGLVYQVTNTNETRISRTVLGGLVDTFFRSTVDDYVKANMEFQKESGLNPQISRTRGPNSNSKCSYCAALVYTGDYKGPSMPAEIFRRHRYCRCNVLYNPMNGKKLQDVWSKREYQDYREAQQKQRQYLNELDKMTPGERRLARNARARELRRARYTPEEWKRRKALEREIAEKYNAMHPTTLHGDNMSSMLRGKKVDVSDKSGTINKSSGADRAAKYSQNWGSYSLNETVRKFFPEGAHTTLLGEKRIYSSPKSKYEIIEDISGNYFRIKDTKRAGKKTGQKYCDIEGKDAHNVIENGRTRGRSHSEYLAATHFNNKD